MSRVRSRLLLPLLFWLPLSLTGCDLYYSSKGSRTAEYADFYLTSNSTRRPEDPKEEKFRSLFTCGLTGRLAAIYIELPDGKRYLLSDVPEEEVAKFFERSDLPGIEGQCYRTHRNKPLTFMFREGKLVDFCLEYTSGGFNIPISPTREGPYYTLPIDRETLLKLFGEPVKWGADSVPHCA